MSNTNESIILIAQRARDARRAGYDHYASESPKYLLDDDAIYYVEREVEGRLERVTECQYRDALRDEGGKLANTAHEYITGQKKPETLEECQRALFDISMQAHRFTKLHSEYDALLLEILIDRLAEIDALQQELRRVKATL